MLIALGIRTLISAAGLIGIAGLSGGAIRVSNYVGALLAALLLGLANAIVKPILFKIAKSMTCVLSCLTLGLWSLLLSWLINGLLFYGVAQEHLGLQVKDFRAAMVGALALSVVNALATVLIPSGKDESHDR